MNKTAGADEDFIFADEENKKTMIHSSEVRKTASYTNNVYRYLYKYQQHITDCSRTLLFHI